MIFRIGDKIVTNDGSTGRIIGIFPQWDEMTINLLSSVDYATGDRTYNLEGRYYHDDMDEFDHDLDISRVIKKRKTHLPDWF